MEIRFRIVDLAYMAWKNRNERTTARLVVSETEGTVEKDSILAQNPVAARIPAKTGKSRKKDPIYSVVFPIHEFLSRGHQHGYRPTLDNDLPVF
jgi:hypothetical protein